MKRKISLILTMISLITCIVLLFACSVTPDEVNTDFSGGDGTPNNPYQITTAEELDTVRDYLDGSFLVMNDIDCEDFLSGTSTGWEPIGDAASPFTGEFDGGGFTISNFDITITEASVENVGLFGYAVLASFSDLTLASADITGGSSMIGSLLGYGKGIAVDDVHATSVTVLGKGNLGGLIGVVGHDDSIASYINSCSSDGSVGNENSTWGAQGGLIGTANNTMIRECFSTAAVHGELTGIGGLAGNYGGYSSSTTGFQDSVTEAYSDPKIVNCYATGTVSGSGSIVVGGLVGSFVYSDHIIENCYATGAVPGDSLDTFDINRGGLIGSIGNLDASTPVDGCYFIDTSLASNLTYYGGYGEAKTPSELATQSTFSGWDFTDIWEMNSKARTTTIYTYPHLQWEE